MLLEARAPREAVRWLLLALILWLLVGPRVELPFANLRLEDLVFVVLAVSCLLHVPLGRRPRGVSLAVFGVAAAGVVSAAVATARGMVDPLAAILYALRPMEYWITFPAALLVLSGTGISWFRWVERVLMATTLLQSTFAVLQYYFDVPVGFSHAAYSRAAGLTVGPYELGAISAALAVFWASRSRWVLASVSIIGLAASVSRISILGCAAALGLLLLLAVVRIGRTALQRGWRAALPRPRGHVGALVVQLVAVAAAGLVLAITVGLLRLPDLPQPAAAPTAPTAAASQPAAPAGAPSTQPSASEPPSDDGGAVALPSETVTSRIADTSILGSWRASDSVAASIPHPSSAAAYSEIAYTHINDHLVAATAAAGGGEASNLVRFFRWHLILDTIDDPADVVFGLGPSFVGPSVDGSYLRFFADGGILGVAAWLTLIVLWLRRSPGWMVCVTVSFLVGGLFIDIVYAERPMVLFWLLLALATAAVRRSAALSDETDGRSEPTSGSLRARAFEPA